MNLNKMMKNLQKMQSELQTTIDALEIEAGAGGGMVTARMNGKKELTGLTISPEVVSGDDVELLQDLVVAAVNEAGKKVDAEIQEATQGMAGGLGLPGMP